MRAYSPVALLIPKINAQGFLSLYNLDMSLAQGLISRDYPELIALGS